jgi:hypothetical protein
MSTTKHAASAASHTPGPWTRTGSTNSDAEVEIHGRMNGTNPDLAPITIATVVRAGDLGWGEGEANAALIAAAPELLEALKEACEQMESDAIQIDGEWGNCREIKELERDGDLPNALVTARAAIARAEGR